jgi:hypothetical protein
MSAFTVKATQFKNYVVARKYLIGALATTSTVAVVSVKKNREMLTYLKDHELLDDYIKPAITATVEAITE